MLLLNFLKFILIPQIILNFIKNFSYHEIQVPYILKFFDS